VEIGEQWLNDFAAKHPLPWCGGVETHTDRAGIIDKNGRMVHESGSPSLCGVFAHLMNLVMNYGEGK
jgi:hypothetical protein